MNKPKKESNFSIPKIKPVKFRDNLREVELTSRDAVDILNIFKRQSMSENYNKDWKTEKVSFVENSNLETEYRDKKKELKENGRSARELAEHYGFLYVKDTYLMNKMVKEGLITKKVHYNPIGDGEHGVYVCKHPDIQLKIPISKNEDEAFIIVFKLVLGRCKAVQPQNNVVGEPMPNYDSYSSSLLAQPSDACNIQNARSQIYLYEYSDEALPLKRPRHCLPYAVVKFTRKRTKTSHAPMPITSYRRLSDYSQEYKPGTYGARNQALKRSSLDNRMTNSLPSLMSLSSTDISDNRGYNMPRLPVYDRYKTPDHLIYSESLVPTQTNLKIGLNNTTPQHKDNPPVSSSKPHQLNIQMAMKTGTEDYNEKLKSHEFQGNGRDCANFQRLERLCSNDVKDPPVIVSPVECADKTTSKPLPLFMRIKKKGTSGVDIKPSTMRRNNLLIEKLDYSPPVVQPMNVSTSSIPVKQDTLDDKSEDTKELTDKPNENAANIQKMINTVNKILGKLPSQETNMDESELVSVDEEDTMSIKGPHTGYVVAPVENEPYEEKVFVEDSDSMSDDDYMPVIRSPLLSKVKNSGDKEIGYVQNLAVQLQSIGDIKEVLSKFNFVNDQQSKSHQPENSSSFYSTDDSNRGLTSYNCDNYYENENSGGYYQDNQRRQPSSDNLQKNYTIESFQRQENRTQSLESNRSTHTCFPEEWSSSDRKTHPENLIYSDEDRNSENLHLLDKSRHSENLLSSVKSRYSENLQLSDRKQEDKPDWGFSSNKNDQFSTNSFGDIDYRRKSCLPQNSQPVSSQSHESHYDRNKGYISYNHSPRIIHSSNKENYSQKPWNYKDHYQSPSSSYLKRGNQALESYSTTCSSVQVNPSEERPVLHDPRHSCTYTAPENEMSNDMSRYSTPNLPDESSHIVQIETKSQLEHECVDLNMKTLNSSTESTYISDSKSDQCKETVALSVSSVQKEDKQCQKRDSKELCVPVEACQVIVVDLCQIGNRRLHYCKNCSAQFDLLTGNLKYFNRKRKKGIVTYLKEKGVKFKDASRKVKKQRMIKETLTPPSKEPEKQEIQLMVDSNLLQNVKNILDGINSENQMPNASDADNSCPEERSTETSDSLTPEANQNYSDEDLTASSQKETYLVSSPSSTVLKESSLNNSNSMCETQLCLTNQVKTTSLVSVSTMSVSTISSTTNTEPMIESRQLDDEDYLFQQHFRHQIDSLPLPETQPTSSVYPVVDESAWNKKFSYSHHTDIHDSEIEKSDLCVHSNNPDKDIGITETRPTSSVYKVVDESTWNKNFPYSHHTDIQDSKIEKSDLCVHSDNPDKDIGITGMQSPSSVYQVVDELAWNKNFPYSHHTDIHDSEIEKSDLCVHSNNTDKDIEITETRPTSSVYEVVDELAWNKNFPYSHHTDIHDSKIEKSDLCVHSDNTEKDIEITETRPKSSVYPVVDESAWNKNFPYSYHTDIHDSEIEKSDLCVHRNNPDKDIEITENISTPSQSNNSSIVDIESSVKSSLLCNNTSHLTTSSHSTTLQQSHTYLSPLSPGNGQVFKRKSDSCDGDNISLTKRCFRRPSSQHPAHLARNPSPPRETIKPLILEPSHLITNPNSMSEDEGDSHPVKTSLLCELKVIKESLEKLSNTSKTEFSNLIGNLTYFRSVAKGNMTVEALKDALLEVEGELVMSLHNNYYMYRPNERIPAPILFDHEIKSVYATGGCFLYLNTYMSRRLYESLVQMKEKILEVYHEKKKSNGFNDRVESLNDQLDALLTKRKLLLRTLTGSVKDSRLRQLEKSKRNFLISLEYIKKSANVSDMTCLEKLYSTLSQHASVVETELDTK